MLPLLTEHGFSSMGFIFPWLFFPGFSSVALPGLSSTGGAGAAVLSTQPRASTQAAPDNKC